MTGNETIKRLIFMVIQGIHGEKGKRSDQVGPKGLPVSAISNCMMGYLSIAYCLIIYVANS